MGGTAMASGRFPMQTEQRWKHLREDSLGPLPTSRTDLGLPFMILTDPDWTGIGLLLYVVYAGDAKFSLSRQIQADALRDLLQTIKPLHS
jgi:hypothetical protein